MALRPLAPLWNTLVLDRRSAVSLQEQIVAYFRDAVLSGRLLSGARVPSSRALAVDQGIARITAVQAYDRLVAEGYLVARRGSGFLVADGIPVEFLAKSPAAAGKVTGREGFRRSSRSDGRRRFPTGRMRRSRFRWACRRSTSSPGRTGA